jgi:hypothetical protein
MSSTQQSPAAPLLRALRSTWLTRVGVVAVLMILGQTVWRGIYLSRGYFTQDDFDAMRLGRASPMGLDLLFQSSSGHFWPVQSAIVWSFAQLAGLDWFVAATSILLTQLVAGLLFWLVLSRILPATAWRLPVLALFLFSPLSLGSVQWWAQAVGYLPSTVCLLAALLGTLHWVQDGRRTGAWACVVFVTLGLLIQERAVFYPFVVLATMVLLEQDRGLLRRIRTVVRRRWALLLALTLVTLTFLVAHFLIALPTEARQGYTPATALRLLGNYVGRSLLPGLVGGPWTFRLDFGVVVVPPVVSVAVAAALIVLVLAWTMWRSRGQALGAWLLFAGYVLLNLAAVMVGRPQFGAKIGLLPRYAADVVPVAALALAFVVRSTPPRRAREPSQRSWERVRPALPWVTTAAIVTSCAVTTVAMAPVGYNRDDRQYVATLIRNLESSPQAVIYDSPVPENVMISWFGERANASTVLAGTEQHAVFDVPSENMMVVDRRGRLVDFYLSYATRAKRGPVEDCGYDVADRTVVRLPKRVAVKRAVVQVSYYAARQNVMTMQMGGVTQVLPIRPGTHMVSAVVSGTFDEVVLSQQDPSATACVGGLAIGFPAPES